jgi:hypothetical protein
MLTLKIKFDLQQENILFLIRNGALFFLTLPNDAVRIEAIWRRIVDEWRGKRRAWKEVAVLQLMYCPGIVLVKLSKITEYLSIAVVATEV